MPRDLGSVVTANELIAAGVLGASATSASVDLGTSRDAYLIIDLVVGVDVPTSVVIWDSDDNTTFTAHTAIANASLAATTLYTADLTNVRRYVRIVHVRAAANADSAWSVVILGRLRVRD